MRSWADRLRTTSMGCLLGLLVVMIFVVPVVMPYGEGWPLVLDVTLTLVLAVGFLVVSDRRSWSLVFALVALVTVAQVAVDHLWPSAIRPHWRHATGLVAFLLLAVLVATRVFGPGRVTLDRLLGAITLYLLIGLLWAVAYELIDISIPCAFQGNSDSGIRAERWFYFSFITLTTVGYGDITPVARAARSLCALEALIGQLFPAVVIARLVALQLTGESSDSR